MHAIIVRERLRRIFVDISNLLIGIVAPLVIMYVALKLKSNSKAGLKQIDEVLELHRETNSLMREILAELRARPES